MSIASTVYVRVVSQDRGRGFMLLVGFDAKIVQSTATQMITLSCPSRENLNATIERVSKTYSASQICDVTVEGVKRQLRDEFGEPHPLTAKQQAAIDKAAKEIA